MIAAASAIDKGTPANNRLIIMITKRGTSTLKVPHILAKDIGGVACCLLGHMGIE